MDPRPAGVHERLAHSGPLWTSQLESSQAYMDQKMYPLSITQPPQHVGSHEIRKQTTSKAARFSLKIVRSAVVKLCANRRQIAVKQYVLMKLYMQIFAYTLALNSGRGVKHVNIAPGLNYSTQADFLFRSCTLY